MPLPYKAVSMDSFPYTVSLLLPFDPFSIVNFAVGPYVDSFAFGFTRFILAVVRVSICKQLVPLTISLVSEPGSFIDSACFIDNDTFTTSLSILVDLASINAIFILLDKKLSRSISQFIIIKFT